jgi:hypothetical protein
MKEKYSISSFLVVKNADIYGSPRIGSGARKTISGILTARDINSFQFDD